MSMQAIDEALRNTEVRQRKRYLISNIKRHGVNQSRDGRQLDILRLNELEWLNIEVINDAERDREVIE